MVKTPWKQQWCCLEKGFTKNYWSLKQTIVTLVPHLNTLYSNFMPTWHLLGEAETNCDVREVLSLVENVIAFVIPNYLFCNQN